MKIGYIRVSRDKQTTALQEDAMDKEHCERVFTDKMSGKRFDRPEFLKMLDLVRAKALYAAKNNTIAEIMQMTGFKSRNTFYKYVVNAERQ